MNHNELLEYSTIIQILRSQIAGLNDAVFTARDLLREGKFSTGTVADLLDDALKRSTDQARRIDITEIEPE